MEGLTQQNNFNPKVILIAIILVFVLFVLANALKNIQDEKI